MDDGRVVGRSKEPVPAARFSVGASRSAPVSPEPAGSEEAGPPDKPSCTNAVASTTGAPIRSSTKAIPGVQSGRPTLSVTT